MSVAPQRSARPRSLGTAPITKGERAELHADLVELRRAGVYRGRPRTWGDCERRTGPCGFVSCRFNLFLDIDEAAGAVRLNFPDRDIDEIGETCALKVAARGGLSQFQVAQLLNISEEWTRQIELGGLRKIRRRLRATSNYLKSASAR